MSRAARILAWAGAAATVAGLCGCAARGDRGVPTPAAGAVVARDVLYRDDAPSLDRYARERCRLDVWAPENVNVGDELPLIVWFHAGGLSSGEKWLPDGFLTGEAVVVAANYRLHPRVTSPVYLQDAAAAAAWAVRNAGRFGADPGRVVLAGHSAGGWLVSMLALDPRWLAAEGVEADALAGAAPISGHAVTHFTVRAERGVPGTRPVVDDMAPLFHVRPDAPPILIVTGDRDLELLGRYEECAYFRRMLLEAGHKVNELVEVAGADHGGVIEPAQPLVMDFVRRVAARDGAPTPR